MQIHFQVVAAIAAASLAALVASAPARATVATYTSQSAFLAAVGPSGTDHYDDLLPGFGPSTYARVAGNFSYVASVFASSGGASAFFNSGLPGDTWLSSDTGADRIVFSSFGAGARAIGGHFFGVDNDGLFFANQPLLLTFTDSDGTTTRTPIAASAADFLGFTTTSQLVSLSVQLGTGAGLFAYPAVNDLIVAQVPPRAAPEPAGGALIAIGFGALLAGWRRRVG